MWDDFMPEVKASGFFFEGCYNKCKEGVKRDSLKKCRFSAWRDKIGMAEMEIMCCIVWFGCGTFLRNTF